MGRGLVYSFLGVWGRGQSPTWPELDEPEAAPSFLEISFDRRDPFLVLSFPQFRKLRGEPLMRELRQRLLGDPTEGTSR